LRGAAVERGGEEAEDGARIAAARQIMRHVGRVDEQAVGARVAMIALLGDGQRRDMDGGIGERRDHPLGRLGRHQRVVDRSDQVPPAGRAALLDDVEAVLRDERVADRRRPQRDADDAPARIARRHRVVGIDRLVRAVERAEAEMDDAAARAIAGIAERRDALGHGRGGQARAGAGAGAHRR
jgi:hypothetical protein